MRGISPYAKLLAAEGLDRKLAVYKKSIMKTQEEIEQRTAFKSKDIKMEFIIYMSTWTGFISQSY
jgi:hypothetical protein